MLSQAPTRLTAIGKAVMAQARLDAVAYKLNILSSQLLWGVA